MKKKKNWLYHTFYKPKYLDFYHRCMESGRLPEAGLCRSLSGSRELLLVSPINDDSFYCAAYWGFSGEQRTPEYNKAVITFQAQMAFTPLRQNIVLLLAALNGEFDEKD